jgi:K+ transporter
VPVLVLVVSHDLEHLAALYAIGVVGAVAINTTLVATHPRLRRPWRKIGAVSLGALLLAIWVTLAFTKLHALAFVTIVMLVGLVARAATKWYARRQGVRPSLIRQAIHEQLTPEALGKRRFLVGTYGSEALAPAVLRRAAQEGAAVVVCFIRSVALSYKYEGEREL